MEPAWDRLADFERRLDRYSARLEAVEEDQEIIGRMDERIKVLEKQLDQILDMQRLREAEAQRRHEQLQEEFARRDKIAREEHERRVLDLRSSRRWQYGAVIATSSIILAGVGLLLQLFENAPK